MRMKAIESEMPKDHKRYSISQHVGDTTTEFLEPSEPTVSVAENFTLVDFDKVSYKIDFKIF